MDSKPHLSVTFSTDIRHFLILQRYEATMRVFVAYGHFSTPTGSQQRYSLKCKLYTSHKTFSPSDFKGPVEEDVTTF